MFLTYLGEFLKGTQIIVLIFDHEFSPDFIWTFQIVYTIALHVLHM